ncbi:uncharacterized protein EV154DRAFT_559023 [Mucor mucedo]|uniref:uncharacterized protein n=1 Tax=Mucor mucedo TaxID=29922 RepID=UPI00221EA217|nr:uncharacterized protein EV154DRAFT_559023 [Mucor mucedo]KAI7895965.1 hypothetical protein EV154DRAFT_559023 [Mucor mucedo]
MNDTYFFPAYSEKMNDYDAYLLQPIDYQYMTTNLLQPVVVASQTERVDKYLPEFHQYSKETYEKKRNKKEMVSRRRVHIQSEQRRRAQIKDGFDALREHLPACVGKKMSKVALLHSTVQHLQHFEKSQRTIKLELQRLIEDNEKLKAQLNMIQTPSLPPFL